MQATLTLSFGARYDLTDTLRIGVHVSLGHNALPHNPGEPKTGRRLGCEGDLTDDSLVVN